MSNTEYERLVRIAQSVLRTWNGGEGFERKYFATNSGKAVIEALKKSLDANPNP